VNTRVNESNARLRLTNALPLIFPYLGLVFVAVLFGILTKGAIFSSYNLKMVFNQIFPTLLCCVGATFYWAHGSLDISISSAMGCAAILCGNIMNTGNYFLALIGAIAIALIFGLVNGLLSTVCKLPAFLASICTLFIGSGIQAYFTLKQVIYIKVDTETLDSFWVKLIVAVVAVLICWFLFEYTFIGKNNIIIGGNISAARYSGIKVNRDMLIAFLLAAVFVGVAAFFNVARTMSVSSTFGSGMQFNVMISMVFGGMLIGGGKNSRISCGVIGAVTYTLVANGLQLAGTPTFYVTFIKGIIFVVVLGIIFRKGGGELLPN
jgi:ribose transport system permease protein